MKTSAILDAAADKIERDGWAQHTLENGDGNMCANGAINFVLTGSAHAFNSVQHPQPYLAMGTALKEIDACFGDDARPAAAASWHTAIWNNSNGRTAAEVIAMLRAVAMTERAREARLFPVLVPA